MNKNNHFHWLAALALGACSLTVQAHGDEPHGDEPHPVAAAMGAGPGFETATDAFELVVRLQGDALTLFINRFETSDPVLQGQVELESGVLKAVAAYQADQGSYVVQDARFIQALKQPGTHPLVVTVTAGDEADLLEGHLTVAAADDGAGKDKDRPLSVPAALAGVLGVVALGASAFAWRRRQVLKGTAQ